MEIPSFTSDPTYNQAIAIAFGVAAIAFLASFFMQTPYGRFADQRFGISLDPRIGWFLMELPSTVSFYWFYFQGPNRYEPFPLFVLFLWSCHYLYRGFLMELWMRVPKGQKSSFSLSVVVIGWIVTALHGYLNATWVTTLHPDPSWSWFADPRFILGALIYYTAFAGNLHSDHVQRNLRTQEEIERGERHYRMPVGGLYRYVTNASYFTELVLWCGFALLTWSPGGIFIVTISAVNLVPRAIATHRWYKERFPDYPPERRILIPFVF